MRVDVLSATEEADEDKLGCSVSINCAGSENGGRHISLINTKLGGRREIYMRKLTIPTPKLILAHIGGNENRAGEATVLPM